MAETKEQKLLETALEAFDAAEQAEYLNRERAHDDLEFARRGIQWDPIAAQERSLEGRPMLTINRMPSFIRQVVNDARLNTPSIRVHPVDDKADVETAEVINGLIRHIEAASNADVAYDTAVENAVSCGFGYIRVSVDYACDDTFDQDIMVERVVNPFSVYGDPEADGADGSDWNTAFVVDSMTEAEFEEAYPDAEKVDWEGKAKSTERRMSDWFTGEKRVRVAEYWRRDKVSKTILMMSDGTVVDASVLEKNKELFGSLGITVAEQRDIVSHEVTQYMISGAEVLDEVRWAGRWIPIIPVYGDEVVVDGERHLYSLIHFAKDAQRMYNYWRTAATELVALAPRAPWIGPSGAFDEDANWLTANNKSHPYLEYAGAIPPVRTPFDGVPAGMLQEALNSSDDMKSVIGIYDASLGARSNETSGRAISARQREGDVSTFHFIDNMTRSIRHAGNIIVDLIPKVYSRARIVRVLGEDGVPKMVPVNGAAPPMPGGQPVPQESAPDRVYDLTTGKYDVVVKAGPSFTTRREEAATQMTELLRTFPDAAPVIGDIVAESLDWPRSDEIAKRLKALLPPELRGEGGQAPEDPRLAQMMQQLQMLAQENAALKAEVEADAAKASLDAEKIKVEQQKLVVDQYRAETERMKATQEAMRLQAPQFPTNYTV